MLENELMKSCNFIEIYNSLFVQHPFVIEMIKLNLQMKYLILTLIIILITSCASKKQSIDDLSTNKEVARFLKKNINKEYTFKEVFDKEIELNGGNFNDNVKKVDLDNNGLTDLIVNTFGNLIIVVKKTNGKYEEINLDLSFNSLDISNQFTMYDSIIDIRNEKALLFSLLDFNLPADSYVIKTDTLIVKSGELLIYQNQLIKTKPIENIEFKTSSCYGTCPVFEIEINKDGSTRYNGIAYTNFIGEKTKTLNSNELIDLIDLIEYSNIYDLKDYYSVNWTDMQTATLNSNTKQ